VRTIFSTADVPQAEAFDYWADVWRARVVRSINHRRQKGRTLRSAPVSFDRDVNQ
jgi:hypothetical protein